MASKWFSSICLVALMVAALAGCSSQPAKSYEQRELEKRADEYLLLGDRFRLQGRQQDALTYYQSAQLIYFKKWQVDKYMLAAMKEAALLVIMNDPAKAQTIIDKISRVRDETGEHAADGDIALTQAMVWQSQDKMPQAMELLDEWGRNEQVALEKRQYMRFYRLWKSQTLPPGMAMDEVESELRSVLGKYYGGQLQNPEVALFAGMACAEFYERQEKYEEAWSALMQAVDIHRHSEVTTQWPRIFLLASRLAEKRGQKNQAQFYQQLYKEQLTSAIP